MSGERGPTVPQFRPLGRIAPLQQVLLAIAAPLLWVLALMVAAYVLEETDAIELGLLVAAAAFVLSVIGLAILRAARRREERRYDDR